MSQITDQAKKHLLTVYLPDTRGVTISRFGVGNLKIGLGVHTYSRLPGDPRFSALGGTSTTTPTGTCPGATSECQSICYAARPVAERGAVYEMWRRNSETDDVPEELPPNCKLLRLHISGDFTSERYIDGWTSLFQHYSDVKVWAYTRSWRVPTLLPALERLRALPNVQLFASMDSSTRELPPEGWRRAWIAGDIRLSITPGSFPHESERNQLVWRSADDRWTEPIGRSFVCPEETGDKPNCEACRYCFDGKRNDVTFLKH